MPILSQFALEKDIDEYIVQMKIKLTYSLWPNLAPKMLHGTGPRFAPYEDFWPTEGLGLTKFQASMTATTTQRTRPNVPRPVPRGWEPVPETGLSQTESFRFGFNAMAVGGWCCWF